MKPRIKQKLIMALQDGMLSTSDLIKILNCRNKRQLTRFMNAVNSLYNEEQIVPVIIESEKHLVLKRG